MALSCNNSYVDPTEACDGRVLVCLQHDTGLAFFDQFDVCGGPASGVPAANTGFAFGDTGNCTLDFNSVTNEPAGFQCFYIPYAVGSHTTDALTIQPTDGANNAIGTACTLNFNVATAASCGGATTLQCAANATTLCWEPNGNEFLSVYDCFQGIQGTLTLDTAGQSNIQSNTPVPGSITPGNSYTIAAGNVLVGVNGLNITYDAALEGTTHSVQMCATDEQGIQVCCTKTITFNPNCATGVCNNLTVPEGTTITPSMVQTGATSFGSPVIAGKTGVTETSSPTSTAVTFACDGTADGTATIRMSDGSTCVVNITCTAVSTLACANTSQTVTAGTASTIPASTLATGGVAPYSLTGVLLGAPSGVQHNGSAITIPATLTAPDFTTFSYTILDANGDTVSCTMSLTVQEGVTTGPTCIVMSDSTFTPTAINVASGGSVTFQSEFNQSTGGLTSAYLLAKNPNGNIVGSPSASGTVNNVTSWVWSPPADCINGAYSICAYSGDATCPEQVVATVNVTGCGGTTTCSTQPTIDVIPSNPSPGDAITITVGGCDCPGFTTTVSGALTNPSFVPISNPTASVIQTTIPASAIAATSGSPYAFIAECCGQQ